jgi:hypothetical protein
MFELLKSRNLMTFSKSVTIQIILNVEIFVVVGRCHTCMSLLLRVFLAR